MDAPTNASSCWDVSVNISLAEDIALKLVYGPLDRFLITVFMPCILVVGLVGNLAFLLVVFRIPWMRTITNRFLTNLAIADVIFLISSVSYALWQFYGSNGIYNEVFLGVVGCVTLPTVADVAHLASISFITLVSVERYYAVCKPHLHIQSKIRTRSVILIIASWLAALTLALLLNIPSRRELATFCVTWPQSDTIPNLPAMFGYCQPVHNSTWVIKVVNGFQTLPYFMSFVANAFMYCTVIYTLHKNNMGKHLSRKGKLNYTSKRNRITAMLIVNGLVFFVCLAPFEFISLYAVIADTDDIHKRREFRTWVDLCRITVYINSVINPFLYNAINPRYRLAFKESFGILGESKTSLPLT